ncbi:stage II sporulation protein P [Clostridium bowmanii]|uniref:stage II sporulation protein P n=1 Tax=Clostridium bowmanii TaxID=132925 RepID=UPI001C0E330E|nr:stage II sporulation protein P [Clostridium bowmanii]MBU3190125.1 stage II sporulation protein P [Clostridium bowmanii]MCA1074720.1 stage II sporulation protein P [Clostridium bowmanii]
MSNEGIGFKGMNNTMPKHTIKKDNNSRMFLTIFTLLIIFLFGVILPKRANANSEGTYLNYFYVNVINNVLSVIKCSNKEAQSRSNENSMKIAALSFLGIDISNPISIIIKEIAYLDNNEDSIDISVADHSNGIEKIKTFILNPFNLDDKQVSKSEDKVEDPNVTSDLYNPKLKQTLNKTSPRVLIYHTHTCEAYRTSDKETLKTTNSLDQTRSVCAVGDVISEELESKYGIAVLHDKTVHDKGDYNNAYKKSGVTLDKYLKEYGNFDLIIDIHRDSVDNKNLVTTKINGENVAKFQFVVTDANPRYVKQKKLIDSMIGISNKLYPNLLRDHPIFAYHRGIDFYSQNKSDNAVLLEVGTYTNDIVEVENTGKYLGRIIAEQLNGKK